MRYCLVWARIMMQDAITTQNQPIRNERMNNMRNEQNRQMTLAGIIAASVLLLVCNVGFGQEETVEKKLPGLDALPCVLAGSTGTALRLERPLASLIDVRGTYYRIQSSKGTIAYWYPPKDKIVDRTQYLGLAVRGTDTDLRNVKPDMINVSCDGKVIPPASVHVSRDYFGGRGLYVAFVFDQTFYMEKALVESRKVAGDILGRLKANDWVCIMGTTYESKPRLVQDWQAVDDSAKLNSEIQASINHLDPRANTPTNQIRSTRIFDAMAHTIRNMPKATKSGEEPYDRKILVVFSTLEDDASIEKLADLKKLAAARNVTIVIVHPSKMEYDFSNAATLAQATGGDVIKAQWGKSLDYRARFVELSAPHLAIRMGVDTSILPADGKNHEVGVAIAGLEGNSGRVKVVMSTYIDDPKSFWVMILGIAIPVFFVLTIVIVAVVVSKQRRRRQGIDPVMVSGPEEPMTSVATETPAESSASAACADAAG